MKLKLFFCMFFVVAIATFNCDELKPKEWKTSDLLLFANPFATFEPSIVLRGHVQYFKPIDILSDQEKKDLRSFLNSLKYIRAFSTIVTVILVMGKLKFNIFTVPVVCGGFLNMKYLSEVNTFQKKLDQSLSSKTNNPSKKD